VYTHILVPVDNTRLAVDTVGKAVQFAKSTGARVTFFHARADFSATDEGGLTRLIAPGDFRAEAAGSAPAVLARAEAAARAAGIAFESVARTSDRPWEAIVETARERGCDLIFMASHGRRGFREIFIGSQTQKVLAHSPVSVLVSSVESNDPTPEMTAAVSVIRGEHRSIAAAVEGLRHLVSQARQQSSALDLPLARSIVSYFKAFPESLHHPKEEEYLFARLSQRSPAAAGLLEKLRLQHQEEHGIIHELESAIERYAGASPPQDPAALAPVGEAADRYAEFLWKHMRAEESEVIPECQRHLTEEDWAGIARAFEANGDPRFDRELETGYEKVFAQLMRLAKAPA
jgi:nucleotide-binding universal stress UspA family protein/hemerythrin-like domain-containing protein